MCYRRFALFFLVVVMLSARAEVRAEESPFKTEPKILAGKGKKIWALAFSPDGKILASSDKAGAVMLWNAETSEQVKDLAGHSQDVMALAFSPDGKTLASGSVDRTIMLWDVQKRSRLRTLKGHKHLVASVAFSPDGKVLVSASHDNTIKQWAPATGTLTRTFTEFDPRPHKGMRFPGIHSVAFSPDGKSLAAGYVDGSVRLLDPDTGKSLWSFYSHTGIVYGVAFSPDGKMLVTASFDKIVYVLNVATGTESQKLDDHSKRVNSIVFSPTGRWSASAVAQAARIAACGADPATCSACDARGRP